MMEMMKKKFPVSAYCSNLILIHCLVNVSPLSSNEADDKPDNSPPQDIESEHMNEQ